MKLIDRVKDKIKKIFPKKKFDVDLKQSAEAATLTSLPSITSIDKVTCYSSSMNDQVDASVSIVKNQILVQEILEEVPEVSRSEAIAVPTASCIDILTTTQKQVLERICHSRSDEQRFVERSRIILAYGSGKNVSQIAKEIGVDRKTVRKWCNRWNEVKMLLRKLEDDDDKKISEQAYRKIITEVLSDEYRSGAPPTFSPEQVTSLYAMACEVLDASPEGVSHWTHKMLADQMVKRGIVKSIAPSTVGRLLCEADLKPHKSRYWLNSPEHGTDSFQVSAEAICDIYKNAAALHQQGVHIISVDEKTGIQALERLNPTHAMEPNAQGSERREHSYDRHGTLTLIANFEVTTGQVIQPTIGETRTEEDFVKHIANTIDIDPDGQWIIITDQLNIHKSESLVEFVAEQCGINEDLGKKGKAGILENMESRKKFLEDSNHRIRLVYTPKHASWLNQIEIWFSILTRRLLRRGSFSSVDDLRLRILKFIDFFNETMAKPFKWIYTGRPLVA